MRNRVGRLLRLSGSERATLIRAVALLFVARLGLWLLPFNTVRRFLRRQARPSAPTVTTTQIGWAISVGKRFVPRANCLPQALAAEALLARNGHPVELRIGVVKTERGSLRAHAWVESAGDLVVGDLTQGLHTYTPLPPLPVLRRSDL
jgi:hypothetical protein